MRPGDSKLIIKRKNVILKQHYIKNNGNNVPLYHFIISFTDRSITYSFTNNKRKALVEFWRIVKRKPLIVKNFEKLTQEEIDKLK